jgi:hypothetical protein
MPAAPARGVLLAAAPTSVLLRADEASSTQHFFALAANVAIGPQPDAPVVGRGVP